MAESLVHTFLGLFDGLRSIPFGKELIVFLISLMPILELRGGLIAAALLGLDIVPAFIICIIGNLLPIPFILWFITPIFNKLKKTKHLSKLVNKIEKKALSKKDKIERRINFYEKETKTSFHGEEMDCSARRCCSDSCSNLLLYCSSRNKHP